MNSSDDDKSNQEAKAQPVPREHRRLLDLIGKFEWDRAFDYKAERSRERVVGHESDWYFVCPRTMRS